MKKHLAIFDMDGTLFDTVPANHAAYMSALEPEGFKIDEEYFAKNCNGRYYKDFLREIVGEDGELLERVHRAKIAAYPKYFNLIRENRQLFDLLKSLRDTHYTALVTTAAKTSVYEILETFSRTDDFDLILTQQEVPRKKPAPDGFFMAMEHFNIPPERTVIFEDSPEGVEAARRSGAAYFVVEKIV